MPSGPSPLDATTADAPSPAVDPDAGATTGHDAEPSAADAASSSPDAAPDAGSPQPLGCPAGSGAGPLGGARPAELKVPFGYNPSRRYALVLELHGRGGDGAGAEAGFKMKQRSNRNGLFVIAPDGTLDSPPPPTEPASFWNATDGCCDIYGSGVDDVAYLRGLICHTQANYAIDPNKVFIIGGSNGAFMAQRMACDAADLVTAVIALSGVTFHDPARCRPTHPVSVLEIHGTADPIVPYDGAAALFNGPIPSARASYETWATLNRCTGPDSTAPVDFDQDLPGAETTAVWKELGGDCRAAVQLWTVNGGTHTFAYGASAPQFFVDWFLAAPPNHP